MKLEKKKEITENLHERLSKSKILFATDYKGLKVAEMTDLRKKLRADGIEYQVVKNTLLIRATENTDFAECETYFKGPTGIAIGYKDPVVCAKLLTKFAKEHDKFKIKGAFLKSGAKGKLLDINQTKALSELPSREILLGQLLSVMNAVPTSLVRALSDIPRRMMNVIQAIKEQKEKAGAAS